ncbi:MAG TPA: Ig-like domain-containing protein, partial [Nitrosospira sp.]|nr:Ig-like domain-containing protein [Nitrosospira sp.]
AADPEAPTVSISAPASGATVTGLVGVDVAATDNTAVDRVELRVNGTTVAIDTASPFAFAWDSTGVPNGMTGLVAYAFDAVGNSKASSAVSVNVANGTSSTIKDTTAPAIKIINPVEGSVSGKNVPVSVNATDDADASGITQTVYIDGVLKATGKGSTLGYNWNIRNAAAGPHTIQIFAKDAVGNTSSASVSVSVTK